MLATLDVPYVDTDATELVWTLDHPPAAALSSRRLTVGSNGLWTLDLRVLGASHQVALSWPDGELIETVACLRGEQPHLPQTARRGVHGRQYSFRAQVAELSMDELRARVGTLRQLATDEGTQHTTVLAAFPSDPDAVTALHAAATSPRVTWHTWHVYPNSRQIVTTSTEVR